MSRDPYLQTIEHVALALELEVTVRATFEPQAVKAELLEVFSNRRLPGGRFGFFHVSQLKIGQPVLSSKICSAVRGVEGVEHIHVTRLERLSQGPKNEIDGGELEFGATEVARLDNDPSDPARGQLKVRVRQKR